MKTTLERLWNEYLEDECAVIETEEEREKTKKVSELHKKIDDLLNDDQKAILEEYADDLHALDALFSKKAFIKGCGFAFSFVIEAGNYGKY